MTHAMLQRTKLLQLVMLGCASERTDEVSGPSVDVRLVGRTELHSAVTEGGAFRILDTRDRKDDSGLGSVTTHRAC